MGFNFPSAPILGEISNGYQWDGEKWTGGAGPATPVTEQFFDVSGLTALDIAVPTWAKACTMDGWEFHTAGGAVMQISGDGTTFAAGASDYGYVGPMHMSGSGGFASLAVSSGSSILLTSLNTDAGMPTSFTVDLMLTRPSTSQRFMGKTYSKFYDVNAVNQYRTMWLECHVNFTATTSLAIKALRILNASQAFGAGSFVRVKWLGSYAEIPTGNAIPEAPQDGGEYTRVNGVWRKVRESFDLAGKTQQDIAVPSWGPRTARLTAWASVNVANYLALRLSGDGTNFAAGASDYNGGGFLHYTGTAKFVNQDIIASSAITLTPSGENTSLMHQCTVEMNIARPVGGATFCVTSRGRAYNNGASALLTQFFNEGWLNGTPTGFASATALKALRLFAGSGALVNGNLDVEWLA